MGDIVVTAVTVPKSGYFDMVFAVRVQFRAVERYDRERATGNACTNYTTDIGTTFDPIRP